MDSKTFREVALSYAAVYNQDLREDLEEKTNFENWVNSLIDEGYDLSDYTWEEVYEAYIEEARDGYGDDSKFNKPDDKIEKPGTTVPKPKKGGYGRISRSTPYGIGAHANRTASNVTRTVGEDPGAPRAVKMPTEKPKPRRVIPSRLDKKVKESYDVYDLILSHLLDEGYAETPEAAEVIMVNMSEDWRDDIIEERKPLPVGRMSKQARRIAFSKGVEDASDEGTPGYVPHNNPERALRIMSRIGGPKVAHHAKQGYKMGTQHDPYYGLGKKYDD